MNDRPACAAVIELWDEAVSAYLAGGPSVPSALASWSASYIGKGRSEVEFEAMPEPYLGRLDTTPAGVMLALHPSTAHLDFQSRTGVFASEIAELGSYSAWAATWPYLREPWTTEVGRNPHHRSGLQFLRRWNDDPLLGPEAIVGFELFPWHATPGAGAIRPDPATIESYVLAPLRELGAPVFAFGAEWLKLLEHELHLPVVDRLGRGGRDYGSSVPSRGVVVFEDPGGLTIIAESHSGSAGPPNPAETLRLRDALGDRPDTPPPPTNVRHPPAAAPRKPSKVEAPRPSCPHCFLQLPTSGICGTCD